MSKTQTWVDAHCHLADERLENRLDDILERSRAVGVGAWVQGGVSPDDWERQLKLKEKFGKAIVTAFGLHPWWVASNRKSEVEAALKKLEKKIPEAQALGELGLDFGPKHSSAENNLRQFWAFESQIEIAKRADKPLILHVVRAHAEALDILRDHGQYPASGIVHSFSSSYEIAKQYLDLGFYLSIGGSITREGFQNIKKAVGSFPLDRIVIETDSPDQTPKLPGIENDALNEPTNLIGIAQVLASLCGVERGALLSSSSDRLRKLFRI